VACLRQDDGVIVVIVVDGDVGVLRVAGKGSMMALRAVPGQNCWRIWTSRVMIPSRTSQIAGKETGFLWLGGGWWGVVG
jgi:hypothetical protein